MFRRSAGLLALAALMLGACSVAPPPEEGMSPAPTSSTASSGDTGLSASVGATGTIQYTQVPGVAMPPWPAPTDVSARVKAAKLDELKSEGSFEHIHQHLDVYYNGQPVTVPAFVGIDPNGAFISPLHTHTPDGILHIESPTSAQITLGQFFTEWNVPLTGATAYVAGKQVADPASVVLVDHQEIAVVYGTPPAKIPSAYYGVWPDGTSLAMPPVATSTP
ncbi:MAG TPA: hypothetical protein V6D47_08620 [Oscillatoriaceae cyanobacterium]